MQYGATPEQRLEQEARKLRARVAELEGAAQSIRARLVPYTAAEGFEDSSYAPGIEGVLRDLAEVGIGQEDAHLT